MIQNLAVAIHGISFKRCWNTFMHFPLCAQDANWSQNLIQIDFAIYELVVLIVLNVICTVKLINSVNIKRYLTSLNKSLPVYVFSSIGIEFTDNWHCRYLWLGTKFLPLLGIDNVVYVKIKPSPNIDATL